MIAIAMTLWRRPGNAREALEALARCEGIADCLLLPHVEPGCDEVRALVEGFDACECRPTWNRERMGCGRNTEAAWADGFARSDFSILVEEDIVLARDALEFFTWARDRYRDDPEVFSVTGYNRRPTPAPASEYHVARRRDWFHPWAALTWRDRWDRVAGTLADQIGWDARLLDDAIRRGGMVEVYPELSRCQNVGEVSSVQDPPQPPAWYREHHRLRHWAGNCEMAPGEWAESC